MPRQGNWVIAIMVLTSCGGSAGPGFRSAAGLTRGWRPVEGLPHPVRAPAVASDGNRIYVFGGSAGASPRTAHTQIHDPATGSWTEGADIPTAVEWSMVVFADDVFHLLGGVTDTAVTDRHWIYDPLADSWSDGPPLPAPSAGSAGGLVGRTIVVAGGIIAPGVHTDRVHHFDLDDGTWSAASRAPGNWINWQAGRIGDLLFLGGGVTPDKATSDAFYSYDPNLDLWSRLPAMPSPNEGYAATAIDGMYCLLGGRIAPAGGSFSTPFDRFDCYDPEEEEWVMGPRLPTAAEELGAVSVGGALYAIGGRISYGGVTGEVYRIGRR